MPSSTDARIEEIIAKIRALCSKQFSPEAEADVELRKLTRELRSVIKQHVHMAKSSLGAKGATINDYDPEAGNK